MHPDKVKGLEPGDPATKQAASGAFMTIESELDRGDQRLADLIFSGATEVAEQCRHKAWAQTALGPLHTWPVSLRALASSVVAAPGPVVLLWGAQHAQIYNEAYLRLMGGENSAGLGQPASKAWPQVWSLIAPACESVLREGRSFTHEDQRLVVDRFGVFEDVVCALSYSPVVDDSSNVAGVLLTVQEATSVERSQKALRQNEERQAFLLKLSDALRPLESPEDVKATAAVVLGEAILANRVFYTEVEGNDWVVSESYAREGAPIPPGRYSAATYGDQVMNAYRSGKQIIFRDTRQDPSLGPAERAAHAAVGIIGAIGVPLLKRGELVAVLVVHTEQPRDWKPEEIERVEQTAERTWAAVEQAKANAALRESEEKYRTLFESIDQGFCVLEVMFDDENRPLDYRFVETNPAFVEHTGLVGALGKTARELIPGLEDSWITTYGRVATTGEPHRFVERSHAMGRWFEVEAFRTGKPEAHRVALLFTDITERKQREAALQEADRRKDEFLAMLAHELRNPLAALANTAKLLERRLPEGFSPRYIEILNRQTGMLRGLLDDLLDVSRITSGLVDLNKERIDLTTIAKRALESVQTLMDEKGHVVTVTLPPNGLPVVGDAVRLEQVVSNLLTNAAKYTNPGGRIALELAQHDGTAEIRIRDSGIGMTSDVLGRIFDLFAQAERGLARSEGGLGIGLTVVKRLVELHGGHINASSAGLGGGAEFVATLPLAPAHEVPVVVAVKEPEALPVTKRVLVVEDSADIAESLAMLLEGSGHTVSVAADGLSGVTQAESFEPDLMLVDIGLPGIDGYEVARRLRKNPRTSAITLVALTGYGQPKDREQAKNAGFDAHFLKPVDVHVLESFVNAPQPAHAAMLRSKH